MEQPPESTDGAAAPVELHPPSIEGVSLVPSVQVLATEFTSEINRSPDKNQPSGVIQAVASSAQGSAAELTSEVKQSPKKSEMSAGVAKFAVIEKHSPENSSVKSNGEIDAQTENSDDKEKFAAVDMSAEMVKSAAIEKHSQTEKSSVKSNGEIDAQIENLAETEKLAAVEKHSQTEKSPVKSNGEIDAQMKKSAQMEKICGETEFILRLDPSGSISLMCVVVSPVYAVLAVCTLWLVDEQPQALLWTFAHLVSFYMFLWIITVSTTKISTVFFRITYVLLLAFTVVHLIGPINGMIFLYTGMIYVAAMLGYNVAEHSQRAGFEQTANTLCSLPFNSKDCEEQVSIMHSVTVVMSLPILARMAWVFLVPHSSHMTHMDVLQLVVELTGEIFILAVLWILYINQFILRGALVSMETFMWTAGICWFACGSLAMFFSFYIAEPVGMLVMWLGWMALGGFFGYSLAVRACYCKMLTGSDSTLAAKEQNGGKQ